MISSMMGGEIDYIIKGIDETEQLITASRLAAMESTRKRFYTAKFEGGHPLLVEGSLAEARVIAVGFRRLIVEVFGVDTLIPLDEISWKWIGDARDTFNVGSRVVVKLLKIEVGKKDVSVTASVKQATADPYKGASEKYKIRSSHVGEVAAMNDFGVYVYLPGGVDCLCPYPDWRNSNYAPGSRVAVMIINVNEEQHRIRGRLLRIISSV